MALAVDVIKHPDIYAAVLNGLDDYDHVTRVKHYALRYPTTRKSYISEPENEVDYLQSRFEDIKESLKYVAFYSGKDDNETNKNSFFILHNYSPIVGIKLHLNNGYKSSSVSLPPKLEMVLEHHFEFGKKFPELEHIVKEFNFGFEYART